jgi:phosphate transport system permease protein
MTAVTQPSVRPIDDGRPRRTASFTITDGAELAGCLLGALLLVWLLFRLLSLRGALGFVVCWYATFLVFYAVVGIERHGRLMAADRVVTVLVVSAGLVALFPLGLVVFYVAGKGIHVITLHFFTQDSSKSPPLILKNGKFVRAPATAGGIGHAIVGTLEQVTIATCLAVPIATMTAIYLNEIGGRVTPVIRFIVDTMSGTPSIIAGLFIYAVLVLQLRTGYSGLAASLALAVLMLPSVTRTAEEVLRIVPNGLRESALALGAPEWRMITRVVVPTARSGIVTASILGVARAVGETAPLIYTAGAATRFNWNPLHGAQASLPLYIYNNIRLPDAASQSRAYGAALVLVTMVLVFFTLARLVGGSRRLGRR